MALSAAEGILSTLLPEWQLLLQGWAADGSLVAAAQEALMLEETPVALQDLVTQWSAGDFSGIPPIVLLSAAEMNGAMGAYASSTNTIYLNTDWLVGAARERILSVLNEELGHSLDAKLNATDTLGDEGEYFAQLLSGATLGDADKAALRTQNDAGTIIRSGLQVAVENAAAPYVRGNSIYLTTSNSTWTDAQASSQSYGGNLVSINSASENQWVLQNVGGGWIGFYQTGANSGYRWVSGEQTTYTNWDAGLPDFPSSEFYSYMGGGNGLWGDCNNVGFGNGGLLKGIAEVPITSGIVFTGTPTEGQTLTTTINLNAGTLSTGNLVNGATVYWSVSGITADDLTSTSPNGLSGSGVITDGKLLLNHQLQADSKVENETFQISVFSDPGMGAGTQIGTTQSVAVQDTPLIRGNSYYQAVSGPYWDQAEYNATLLGGHLTTISSKSENDFVADGFETGASAKGYFGNWIGMSDAAQEGVWRWSSGEVVSFTYWGASESATFVDDAWGGQDYGALIFSSRGWDSLNPQPLFPTGPAQFDGIAEVPITSSIVFTGTPTEGQTLTTTINLNAGTLSTGNLVNGATVYWSVSGITADDLTSGALTGSGVIANGKLVLTHVLKVDADTGEQFKVSVFSDAAMTQQIGTTSFAAVQEAKSVIRANSLYTVVNGPNWLQAEASSVALGGHLTCIGDQEENEFLRSRFSNDSSLKESLYRSNDPYNSYVSWIGLSYNFASGDWFDTQGNRQTYFNWFPPFKDPISTEFGAWQVSMLLSSDYPFTPGSWDDSFENQSIPYFRNGIAEVPITSGIVFSGTPKEGQTLTTTINLNAGTQTTGNLVNGATVYWSVSGITADDLTSGALTGSGVIANGKLVLTHVLKVDADTGEQFKVSVFSDAEMTQQIGTTATTTVQSVTPVLQGNSLYVVIDGPTWVKAQENAVLIGGNLASIGSASENNFIADYLNKNHEASNAIWIGLTDEVAEGDWKWTTGEALNYENWYPGEPSDSAFSQYLEDYAVIVTRANPNGDNGPVLLGQWGDDNNAGAGSFIGNGMGIAEIPITSSIVFSGTPKEGQTLTTTINLNAGTQTTGNLVNGATVYWSVSGITAEDLTSGALTGSGVIANGTLVLTHGLKVDADTGEQFKVSVFSDAEMTQQIGTTASTAIQESDNTAPTVTNILVQGTTVILKCSEAVSATSVPTTTFKVETISGSTVTTRTISQVALDQNDATKVILTLTGTAPLSSVNLRVSYTDPAGDQGTGVIQDLAGNDLGTTPTPNQYQFADTFLSGSNATIASEYKTLNLTGGTAINGTGNALANAIVGNSAKNVITGGLNADILTGLGNADTFKFALADSRLSAMDRITDLVIGTDSIDGPSSCSAANLIEFGSVASLAEADIASVLNQNVFASNRAATFTYGSGASQQTFLVLNNGTKGFQSAGDAIIEITGFQGQLTNLAVI